VAINVSEPEPMDLGIRQAKWSSGMGTKHLRLCDENRRLLSGKIRLAVVLCQAELPLNYPSLQAALPGC